MTAQPDDGGGRVVGSLGATAVVAGSMLGVGIFLTPPLVAAHVSSVPAFFGVWLAGAVVALCGAAAYAELATLMPQAGGDYVYQRRALGPSVAFATGLVMFTMAFAGSIAAMSAALCQYQVQSLSGLDLTVEVAGVPAHRWLGVGVVVAVTALNAAGARVSAWVQAALTLVPLVLLAGLAIWALASGVTPDGAAPARVVSGSWADAFLPVYFAYAGWPAIVYIAGEVKDPARVLPRAMLGGTVVVTALYMLLCAAFVAVLGLDGLAGAGEAGSALVRAVLGPRYEAAFSVLLGLAILASINGTVLGGARVAYAMARDRAFFGVAGRLGRGGAPVHALWIQALVAAVFLAAGTFSQIVALSVLAMMLVGSVTVACVVVLRVREPGVRRVYRALGYPLTPVLFISGSAVVTGLVLSGHDAGWSCVGLGLLAVAWGGHRVFGKG